MQFLCNKTEAVLTACLGNLGVITFEPYEYIETNVDTWNITAFNAVKQLPTKLALCDKVPAKLIEKRKLYLELVQNAALSHDIDATQSEIEELKENLKSRESTLLELESDISQIRHQLENPPKDCSEEFMRNLKDCETRVDSQISDVKKDIEELKVLIAEKLNSLDMLTK